MIWSQSLLTTDWHFYSWSAEKTECPVQETADANAFLAVFVGVVTGVGGGLLRDVMASVPPYIFTKVVLRLLASRFRWKIPKAEDVSLHHTKNHSGKG